MPEIHFRVRWPDQSPMRCYSPSRSIKEALAVGRSYPVADFVAITSEALERGSERVRRKYGFGCGHAAMQVAIIESFAKRFAGLPNAQVTVEAFED